MNFTSTEGGDGLAELGALDGLERAAELLELADRAPHRRAVVVQPLQQVFVRLPAGTCNSQG